MVIQVIVTIQWYFKAQIYTEKFRNLHHPSNSLKQKWCEMQLLLLGDTAFPFSTWIMKLYANTALTKEQGYFNYRQNRAQMAVGGEHLVSWWSVEGGGCLYHISSILFYDSHLQRRPRVKVVQLLTLTHCYSNRDYIVNTFEF